MAARIPCVKGREIIFPLPLPSCRASRYRSIIHLWRRSTNNERFRRVSWWLLYSITAIVGGWPSRPRGGRVFSRNSSAKWAVNPSGYGSHPLSSLGAIGARLHRSEKSLSAETLSGDNSIRPGVRFPRRWAKWDVPPSLLSGAGRFHVPAKFKRSESESFFARMRLGNRIDFTRALPRYSRKVEFYIGNKDADGSVTHGRRTRGIIIKLIHRSHPRVETIISS